MEGVKLQESQFDSYIDGMGDSTVDDLGNVVESAPVAEVDIEAFIVETLPICFGIVAARCGDHWQLQRAEAEALAGAWCPVLDKYFPDAGKALGIELTAVITTALVVGPKWMQGTGKKQPEVIAANDDVKKPVEAETVEPEFGNIGKSH